MGTTIEESEATASCHCSATYSPEDNKLRISCATRLGPDDYAKVKAAGYRWAPVQGVFVAPAWSPEREDVALALAGEIGDEDTTLSDRAEERAERFDRYQESRRRDAERASEAVHELAGGIPLGQPILVGHHSERRARKDAERIRGGLEKAARMWDTAAYWRQRAAGALQHARYKELLGVRARRIKGLEADRRRFEAKDRNAKRVLLWLDREAEKAGGGEIARERLLALLNVGCGDYRLWSGVDDGSIEPAEAVRRLRSASGDMVEWAGRWMRHLSNRIAYETALLGESGAMAGDAARLDAIEAGGKVRHGSAWYTVLRVNRKGGHVCSVRVDGQRSRILDASEIEEYEPPAEGVAEAVKEATKKPPLCNYRAEGSRDMTAEEYQRRSRSGMAGTRTVAATDSAGAHRLRHAMVTGYRMSPVFITDAKEVAPPSIGAKRDFGALHAQRAENALRTEAERAARRAARTAAPDELEERRKEAARLAEKGVSVVIAPELFPTPRALARRMCDLAGILSGRRILEPSAGTGDLWAAAVSSAGGCDCCRSACVESSPSVFDALAERHSLTLYAAAPAHALVRGDFLEQRPEDLGAFGAVLMNPPFSRDVAHVEHARRFVGPGGVLVAIVAAGPRQDEAIRRWGADGGWSLEHDETIEGAFLPSTGVRVRLISLRRLAAT